MSIRASNCLTTAFANTALGSPIIYPGIEPVTRRHRRHFL
jgi:hypothetical protein